MSKILIVGAGPLQLPLIRKAKEIGLITIAVDYDNHAVGREEADFFYNISTNDTTKLLELAKYEGISGVITNSDYPVRTVSTIAQSLGLNGMSLVSATIATNKLLLREVLWECGIRSPKFRKITDINEIIFYTENIGFPFILKPVDSSASRGVSLVTHEQFIVGAYERALKYSTNGLVIMEEYVGGREFSVESFSTTATIEVIAVTEKTTTGAPFFVETGHIIPASISIEECNSIEITVKHALRAVGINYGPSHAEVKVNDKGVHIIEIGPRLGGDYISADLVPLATGYDMVENAIRQAVGQQMRSYASIGKAAGVVFFTAEKGVITHINGLEDLANLSYVERSCFFQKIGDEARPLLSSSDRIGYAIVVGNSAGEVKKRINSIRNVVSIETK